MAQNIVKPRLTPGLVKGIFNEYDGDGARLIASCHHGLYEVSLKQFYPFLNLEEVLKFSLIQWDARNTFDRRKSGGKLDYSRIGDATVYELFDYVLNDVYSSSPLNPQKNIPSDKIKIYRKFNPYSPRTLESRLKLADSMDVAKLKKDLLDDTNQFVLESDYHERKMMRFGDNSGLVPMFFQMYSRKNAQAYVHAESLYKNYASEIAKIINGYPNLTSSVESLPVRKRSFKESEQLCLV